jgi:DNA polymerase I
MKCRCFLLDVNEAHGLEKPTVRVWGVDDDGQRIVVFANQIKPYFYVVPPESTKLKSIQERLLGSDGKSEATQVSEDHKKILGRERNVLKVACVGHEAVNRYSREVPRLFVGAECYEQDIRLAVRYIIDFRLVPCGWNEIDADETPLDGLKVNHAYVANSVIGSAGNDSPPTLRLMGFSLLTASEQGSAKAERDPVRAIACATNSGDSRTFVCEGDDDFAALKEFESFVNKFDPDIIVGFENNRLDWPYLIERAKLRNVRLDIGRDGSEPHSSLFGHTSIAGRVNLDVADIAGGFPEIKVKKIENFAKYLGVLSAKKIETIEEFERFSLWSDKVGRERLLQNTILRAQASLELAEATINFPMQLSNLTGLTLDQVVAAAVGFRVDSYLMRQAWVQGELIPPRNEQPFLTYRGAIVLEPRTGVHDNVAVLDFTSMYPSLMERYNLSPDTLVRPGDKVPEESVFVIPDVGHRFKREPDGFFRTAIRTLLAERKKVKAELEAFAIRNSAEKKSARYEVLKERERALKIISNACYGYAGWAGARWYVREVAESAAALGRETITKTITKADALGLQVIYGDTDSIFVKNLPEKIKELKSWATQELDLEIRIAREYVRILFTEAMKRYAGLLPDDTLDIVGLEVVRGDWSDIARQVQEQVLESILRDKSTEDAVQKVRETIQKLQKGEIPITDLTIHKTLSKRLEDYRVRTPHVEVARKLLKQGWYLAVGDKVGYVITQKGNKLFEKAQPYTQVSREQVDVDYYLENQVKPAAMRILELFGVNEKQLTA